MTSRFFQSLLRPMLGHRSVCLTEQRGQAVLEYILVLVISLSVVLGLIYQFNDAFRSFTANYFGNYLTCLLEAGELPGTGGLCEANYKPFSLADGRPLISSGLGGSGSSSQASSGSRSPDQTSSQESKKPNKQNQSGSGDLAQSERAVTPTIPSSPRGGFQRLSERDDESKKRNGKDDIALSSQEQKQFSRRSYTSLNASTTGGTTSEWDQLVGRQRFVPASEDEQQRYLASDRVELTDSDRKRMGGKVPLSIRSEKEGNAGDDDVGLTLPNFIRYLMIAAILIVLFLFLGGQVVAFRKGQQKG